MVRNVNNHIPSCLDTSGNSLIVGFAAGMETMCGQVMIALFIHYQQCIDLEVDSISCSHINQAYGAKNFKMLGLVMQRAMLLCTFFSLPIFAAWQNIGPFLALLQLPPEIVAGTSR